VLPNVETGGVLGITRVGGGLRPPAPSSVEPSGIPTRATDDAEAIPVGDEADAEGPAKELPPIGAQVPDALPAMPPPSNTDVEAVPAADIPVPADVPVIEVLMPDVVPLVELGEPNDACGNEPPKPEQVAMLLVVSPSGDVPDVNGLTPRDPISVAPMGMPVGATGAPGPMPSGDVMPSGDEPGEIAPTCAAAAPQSRTAAAIAATKKKRVIADFSSFGIQSSPRAVWHANPTT
jgi:hypothetical protein